MNIVIALLIFSLIILFHELGHFLLAKMNKVTVVEFSLGMGPRLLSFSRGGTRYSLKLLPFGGSCMMLGEDEATTEPGSFASKSVWARISVIAAGPIFNFILAFLMSLFIVGSIGYDAPVLVSVSEGSPAAEAGLEAGDRILKMNSTTIHVSREITNYTSFHPGETVRMVWEHDGERKEALITPAEDESGNVRFGISVNPNLRVKGTAWDTIKYSAYEVRYWIVTTIESLKMLFKGQVSINDMSGPVGVVDVISDTYEESKSDGAFYVWLNMLNISILLSANLGVMNLLPLPALDGGRLVFLILEAIRRKRIDPEKEGMVHFVGLMALMVLMVVVMFNDVRKLF
ncbi:MAG: RIP metalloprotease RseP [Eubacteriales bacterium]|nr:RIP metalloprotease RseP [Eubacteriales bacterium]